jgi:hypothetical protein
VVIRRCIQIYFSDIVLMCVVMYFRHVDVAIFRIKDFSDPKHRFKVDVNMQQLNLTGLVVLCPAASTNLVVAEGGPKGIKKFIHLMTNRYVYPSEIEFNKIYPDLVVFTQCQGGLDER